MNNRISCIFRMFRARREGRTPGWLGKITRLVPTILLVTAFALCVSVIFQVQTTGYASFGGRSFFRVVTGSMEPKIPEGALLICQRTEIAQIQVGDIICYRSHNAATRGWIITHRVIAVLPGGLLQTKGDANAAPDGGYVSRQDLIGRVVWHTKEGNPVARLVSMLTSGVGFMSLILVPCLVIAGLIMSHSVRGIRKEMDLLAEEERKAEEQSRKPAAQMGQLITPEEYAEMRQRIWQELMAQRETMMQALQMELSRELAQGEAYEKQKISSELALENGMEQAEEPTE